LKCLGFGRLNLIYFFLVKICGFVRDECTTAEYLRKEGFTSSMIDRFFSPFYQGIFLAPLEEQSSRMFEYVFRMFLSAPASLPSKGKLET